MKYDKLCEMDIGELLNTIMGSVNPTDSKGKTSDCTIQNPIQPTDNIGSFGNEADVKVILTPEGGLEIDSKEIAVKLSSNILEAIKSSIKNGE